MTKQVSSPVLPRLLAKQEDEWKLKNTEIVIGKDILELLSSSMYVDPMTIYREYVQNAADAIDEARRVGLLVSRVPGRVQIDCSVENRTIRIRDNGTGVSAAEFDARLTAFGASYKRGMRARGFRGVGRLAGLGYCQELIFRSRASGESRISELRWDCRRLKTYLRAADFSGNLAKLVGEIVSVRQVQATSHPDHYFEVELRGIVRHRNDRLLSAPAVSEYLSQVGPVPFSPDFPFAERITERLAPHVPMGNVEIYINGADRPIIRPHGRAVEVGDNVFDAFTDVEIREMPDADGRIAAVAWILHHGYTGAIPSKSLIKGLRLRNGNIQIGDAGILEELFPEPRFNAWAVGEIHVIDSRITPNGRRDHFEQSVHFDNLLNHIAPVARDIARRCRSSSIQRQRLREFELTATALREKLGILAQGAIAKRLKTKLIREAKVSLAAMEKIATAGTFPKDLGERLRRACQKFRGRLGRLGDQDFTAAPLSRMTRARRAMYEHLFEMIYECSQNRTAAKVLVDRILLKID